MALFHESRLIHTEPCLIITERKTRMGVDFCYTLYKRKYSKGLNRWMELSSFIHISYRHDGLDAHTLYVFRFLSWKERWMFTISRGMTSKIKLLTFFHTMRINKLSVIDSKKVFENKQIFGMSFCLQRINKLIELNSFNKTPLSPAKVNQGQDWIHSHIYVGIQNIKTTTMSINTFTTLEFKWGVWSD